MEAMGQTPHDVHSLEEGGLRPCFTAEQLLTDKLKRSAQVFLVLQLIATVLGGVFHFHQIRSNIRLFWLTSLEQTLEVSLAEQDLLAVQREINRLSEGVSEALQVATGIQVTLDGKMLAEVRNERSTRFLTLATTYDYETRGGRRIGVLLTLDYTRVFVMSLFSNLLVMVIPYFAFRRWDRIMRRTVRQVTSPLAKLSIWAGRMSDSEGVRNFGRLTTPVLTSAEVSEILNLQRSLDTMLGEIHRFHDQQREIEFA